MIFSYKLKKTNLYILIKFIDLSNFHFLKWIIKYHGFTIDDYYIIQILSIIYKFHKEYNFHFNFNYFTIK